MSTRMRRRRRRLRGGRGKIVFERGKEEGAVEQQFCRCKIKGNVWQYYENRVLVVVAVCCHGPKKAKKQKSN